MKKITILFLGIFITLLTYSYEIKDNKIYDIYGNNIEIKNYNRVVVIDPAAVETIFMINGEKNIVGISDSKINKIWPYEKTSKITSIGNAIKPSFEKIISLKPDLVILNKGAMEICDRLNKLKIAYLVHDSSKDLDKILESIKIYGKIFNKIEESNKVYNENLAIIKDIEKKKKNFPLNKKGLILYSTSPMISFSDEYLPGKVLDFMGINNISKNTIGQMPIISPEYILKENINVIIASKNIGNINNLISANPVLKKTNVYKENNIIFYDTIDFLRGSPRIFQSIYNLYNLLEKQ